MSNIGDRIKEAADALGGIAQLSTKTGIPKRTLYGYVSGPAEPTAGQIAAIRAATGLSLQWLVLGEEPKVDAPADRDDLSAQDGKPQLHLIEIKAFEDIGRRVRTVYEKAGAKLPPDALAAEIAHRYNLFVAERPNLEDSEEVELRLRLLEKGIERDIQKAQAEPGSGKREVS